MQLTWVPVGLKHVSCQLSLVCLATHYAEDPKSSNLHSYQCLKQHKNVNVSTNSLCYSFSGLKIYFFVSKHFISVSRSKSHLAVKKITFNSEDSLIVQQQKDNEDYRWRAQIIPPTYIFFGMIYNWRIWFVSALLMLLPFILKLF